MPLVVEQQWREFMQTPSPREPFMRRQWRYIKVGIDARFFERISIGLRIAAESATATTAARPGFELAAAIADEHHFDIFLETVEIGNFVGGNAAAGENSDV